MLDILLLNRVNLVLQAGILLLFLFGLYSKSRSGLLVHGRLMTVAVILNTASTLFFMIPLFVNAWPIVTTYTDTNAAIFLAHHVLGAVALVLSLVLVGRFVRARFTLRDCKGKWLMRITATTWGGALVLGLILYVAGYFPG
ncbi:MAG: hypothetical protein FJ151_00075 [Euryarchaeota archaeon]|nr:hypothetical protein [Euryarchaeota archaeon]